MPKLKLLQSNLFKNHAQVWRFSRLLEVNDNFRVLCFVLFLLQFPWSLLPIVPYYGFSNRQRTLLLPFIQVLSQVISCQFTFFMIFQLRVSFLLIFSLTWQIIQLLFILLPQPTCLKCIELCYPSFLRNQFAYRWASIFLPVFLKTFSPPYLFLVFLIVLSVLQIQQFFSLLRALFIFEFPVIISALHLLVLDLQLTFYELQFSLILFVIPFQGSQRLIFL